MIKINGIKTEPAFFPDGTSAFRVSVPETDEIVITWCFDGNSEMAELFFLVNHIRSQRKNAELTLEMPYIPNARMDRVKNNDEVFTLKYFAGFINSLNFACVKVYDPHSDVSAALLNSVQKVSHMSFIEDVMEKINFDPEKDMLFYPDAGCAKKYESVFKMPYLKGDKKRDWRTGKILGLELSGDVPSSSFRVLMIDDICSKGGTFFHSAKKLREAGASEIYLYITHCENTILEGELIGSGLVERIFTTDSIFTKADDNIEIIKSFR